MAAVVGTEEGVMAAVVGTEEDAGAAGVDRQGAAPAPAARILRRARASARMTQRHLAAAAGVSERTVSRAERGDPVAAESVRALCAVLGLDAAALPAPKEDGPAASSEGGFSAPPPGAFWRAAAVCGAFSKRTSGAPGRMASAVLAAGMAFGAAAFAGSAFLLASGRPAEASIGAALAACLALAFLSDRIWRRCGLYGSGVPDWIAGALGWICWCALAGPLGLASWGAISLAAR